MPRFEHAVSMLVSVILRKCISVFEEFAYLFIDIVAVVTSTIRFSNFRVRQPSSATTSSVSYFPLSSMAVRHDR
ncbi:hypothetical protein SLEP1_g16538 [Rubroshorea leprosula]|uniref:Secreted protein n=1 Tax=Rubroshorea leprosula TaxID=152421 RepID=A0AAV5IX21_9ROSI|nr:hypothetical protein SLEP1_g16538 [Rubroshorea leprosula]